MRQDHIFQRLDVDSSVALKMFEDNAFKAEQIPHIATKSSTGRSVTVYRVGMFWIQSCKNYYEKVCNPSNNLNITQGDHIDISRGPMIASSSLVGRCSIAAVCKNFYFIIFSKT